MKFLNNPKLKKYFAYFIIINLPIQLWLFAFFSTPHSQATYTQPPLNNQGLQIRSIDTQIVTKHWGDVPVENIQTQVSMLKELNPNFISISVPYDHPERIKLWADEIHRAGLNVWFRSHWLNWEGEENRPRDLTPEQYIKKTQQFIIKNNSIFQEGDAFTMAVEPEQVGVQEGSRISSWDEYNQFIVDQIDGSNDAFTQIGLKGKIHTNWMSMNGWVVDKGLKPETVKKMGLITVDHYPTQDVALAPEVFADNLANDLEKFFQKWKVPIILGEWGYHIKVDVSDEEQEKVISAALSRLKDKSFLIGFNYWAHMGNSARLINDQSGTSLQYRPAANALKQYFLSTY
jgi:hypothetical protein